MARVASFERTGGPEVIAWADVDLPDPAPGEARVRHTAVGLNYIDTYHRSGLYPVPLPGALGSEAVGVVEAVGAGVEGLAPGTRVGTFGPALGAYATHRNVAADSLFKLPHDIDDRTAAAVLLKGCTAEFLIERCARVERGRAVLVHAAAGGVGHLLVQWLAHIGAVVIASAGGPAKAASALQAGATHAIDHRDGDVAARVRELTDGRGVDVVLDGVGMATWTVSLAAVRRRGLIVSYGNAGGAVTGIGLGALAQAGSIFVTRPTLYDYYRTPDERQAGVARLFDLLRRGVLSVEIGQTFAIEDAAQAHRALEAGETRGSSLLLP